MQLRPLNDTVIIDPYAELTAVDNDQKVLDVINRGIIILPEKNMLMKLSNKAKVISYGSKCNYRFQPGQDIFYDQFADSPVWIEYDNHKYRFIRESYIWAVVE